ncbi:hypothetical protein ACOME3_003443 [Neoechinorhynchus agilis]
MLQKMKVQSGQSELRQKVYDVLDKMEEDLDGREICSVYKNLVCLLKQIQPIIYDMEMVNELLKVSFRNYLEYPDESCKLIHAMFDTYSTITLIRPIYIFNYIVPVLNTSDRTVCYFISNFSLVRKF